MNTLTTTIDPATLTTAQLDARLKEATANGWAEELLIQAAVSDDVAVRRWTAKNPSTGGDLLAHLLTDESWSVREAAASHPNLDPALLMDVVEDPFVEVRWVVATRTRDGAVLTLLAGDEDWMVLLEVWRNEACPPMVLGVLGLTLLAMEADDDLRDLLTHPRCPQWLRVRVAVAYPAWDVWTVPALEASLAGAGTDWVPVPDMALGFSSR